MNQESQIVPIVVMGLIYWLVFATVAAFFSESHGRSRAEGFWLTVFFGPLGFLAAAILPGPEDRPTQAMPQHEGLDQWRPESATKPPPLPAKYSPKTTNRPTH